MTDDRGPWATTHSGTNVHVFDPSIDEIKLSDIAHHLSMICRYNGAADQFLSVAEHSVMVSAALETEYADTELSFQGLMHDAGEYLLGDIIRPIKVKVPLFSEVENRFLKQAICPRYAMEWPFDYRVAAMDMRVCATEKRDLLPNSGEWHNMPDPLDDFSFGTTLTPAQAKTHFLKAFDLLWERREAL